MTLVDSTKYISWMRAGKSLFVRKLAGVMEGQMRAVMAGLLAGVWAAAMGGCAAPEPNGSVSDPSPVVKIPAMKRAVQEKDLAAVGPLIQDLESEDPAVRFYAIYSLEKLTGERFGYDYFAEEGDRRKAVQKWKQWYTQQTSQPSATAPAATQ